MRRFIDGVAAAGVIGSLVGCGDSTALQEADMVISPLALARSLADDSWMTAAWSEQLLDPLAFDKPRVPPRPPTRHGRPSPGKRRPDTSGSQRERAAVSAARAASP
jgi:hypothetical protein